MATRRPTCDVCGVWGHSKAACPLRRLNEQQEIASKQRLRAKDDSDSGAPKTRRQSSAATRGVIAK
ncbi:MAG: hypothetical protein ACRD3E_09315 [Terriglobales bacterium]